MPYKIENYYLAVLFLLKTETDVNLLEVGDLNKNEIWAILVNLSELQLVNLSKTHAFISDKGNLYLKMNLLELENKLIDFIKKRSSEISSKVNTTEFMVDNFIKPDPKSVKTTNDRDFGVFFIKSVESKNIIEYDKETLEHVNFWFVDTAGTIKRWFDNLDKPLYINLKKHPAGSILSNTLPIKTPITDNKPTHLAVTSKIKKSKSIWKNELM
ncbi:MAG: hypothetical protein ABI367_09520, partial [Mucilaginibacter sp.]